MTLMPSGCHSLRFTAAGCEPVGGGQRDGVFGQHPGQAGEDVGEVFLGMDAQVECPRKLIHFL